MKRPSTGNSGSMLMLALWAVILISVVVFAWIKLVDRGIEIVAQANRGLEARALAHSGYAVALHPDIKPNSPHLKTLFGPNRGYHVTIKSEGARLNVNFFLAGNDPDRIEFFKQYLIMKGFTVQERAVFMDCLLDWVSPSEGLHRANGIPESLTYRPPHRPLQSLDEIPLVHGSGPLIAHPHWQEELTLFSSGPLDLESVPGDLLALVPGIGEQRAQQFVKIREKRENDPKNKEGRPFKDLDEAVSFLGMSSQQFAQISRYLGFHDPVLHIQSEGESGKVVRQVEAIVRKVPEGNAQILLWSEK